jgi:hypothetical protein
MIRNALEGTSFGGVLLLVADVTLNSADLLLTLSDLLLPMVSVLVGPFGASLGVDQDLAMNALLFAGTLYLLHKIFRLIDTVKDET